jgi:flavin-binding protein dodecin
VFAFPGAVLRAEPVGEHGRRKFMSEHIYKVLELVGSSTSSIEDAIQTALSRAGETLRNIRWFQVVETRGAVNEGRVAYYQVTVKVGFTLEG